MGRRRVCIADGSRSRGPTRCWSRAGSSTEHPCSISSAGA